MGLPLWRRTRHGHKPLCKYRLCLLGAKGTEQASRHCQPDRHCNPDSSLYIPHLPMFDVLQASCLDTTFTVAEGMLLPRYIIRCPRKCLTTPKLQVRIRKRFRRGLSNTWLFGMQKDAYCIPKDALSQHETASFTMRAFIQAFICRRHLYKNKKTLDHDIDKTKIQAFDGAG